MHVSKVQASEMNLLSSSLEKLQRLEGFLHGACGGPREGGERIDDTRRELRSSLLRSCALDDLWRASSRGGSALGSLRGSPGRLP